MDDLLIQNDYTARENEQPRIHKMEMLQTNEPKESFWIKYRVVICTIVGLLIGCILTICILWPIYSSGMDKILQQKCPRQTQRAKQAGLKLPPVLIEHGNTSLDDSDVSGSESTQTIRTAEKYYHMVELNKNSSIEDLTSIRKSRIEMINLINDALMSCTGDQADIQKIRTEVDIVKEALQNNSRNAIDKLNRTRQDVLGKIANLLNSTNKGQREIQMISEQIKEALADLKNLTDMAISGINVPGIIPGFDGFNFTFPTSLPLPTTPVSMTSLSLSCMKDCRAWYNVGQRTNGVYCVQPDWVSTSSFNVYCDMTTDNGGWTVFQRRVDGSEDFFRGWDMYKNGFGNLTGEFWLGNKYIHILTETPSELRVELMAWDNSTAFAKFSSFMIGDEKSKYILTISGYSGTAGDALDYHNGHTFSTKDQDNSISGGGCAKDNEGAWWYKFCSHSSLNGKYYVDGTNMHTHNHGVNWEKFKGDRYSLKRATMMLRRIVPEFTTQSTAPTTAVSITTAESSCMKDCKAWYDDGQRENGVYCIQPDWVSTSPFNVYCDMKTDGGGWTVFQRRLDGSEDFFRGWDWYKKGFGNLTGEFWLGNDYIHILTETPSELRVDVLAWDNSTAYAKFSSFKIGAESSKYMLTISGYRGTAGDALDYHDGHKFSTKDQDNSISSGGCAKDNEGAWWYNYCSHSSLNGIYYAHGTDMGTHNHGVNWEKFKGDRYSLKGASMMLRRK